MIGMFLLSMTLLPTTFHQNCVKEFHKLKSPKEEQVFIDKFRSSKDPVILGYVCALEMKKAEYALNPIDKLSIFNKSKNQLEDLISRHPNNIHLRYIRLTIQEKLPSILGYSDNIKADKAFIILKLKSVDASDFLDVYIIKNTSL